MSYNKFLLISRKFVLLLHMYLFEEIKPKSIDGHGIVPELLGTYPTDLILNILELNPEIIQVCFKSYSGDYPENIGGTGKPFIWLHRSELMTGNKLEEIVKQISPNSELGIYSRVKVYHGEFRYIPMMDFRIPKSPSALKLIVQRFRDVGINYPGWILDSGSSYHYYGAYLINLDEWMDFLGRCLLTSIRSSSGDFSQVADCRNIGHSLKQGGSVLRITANSNKRFMPRVVARI